MTLILASTSRIRQAVLANAGVAFTVRSPLASEVQIKKTLSDLKPVQIAMTLAEAKAASVSTPDSAELVLGADQVLALEAAVFDKPRDLTEARAHLIALRGRTHELHSTLCCMRGGKTLWRHAGMARLTMRDFSAAFLDRYLARAGSDAASSVGVYKLEGEGIQLFEKIEGDYFTILGLPLLPLLGFLRQQGEIVS
jgi:septum formation protein